MLLLTLHSLPQDSRFNIIGFGRHWVELFPMSVLKKDKCLKQAIDFVKVSLIKIKFIFLESNFVSVHVA